MGTQASSTLSKYQPYIQIFSHAEAGLHSSL